MVREQWVPAYIDPDIGNFFINDEGLHVLGDSSSSCLPLGLVLRGRDKEGWRQEDKLEPLLGTVQEHGPGTGRIKEEAAGAVSGWQGRAEDRTTQGHSLSSLAGVDHGYSGCGGGITGTDYTGNSEQIG